MYRACAFPAVLKAFFAQWRQGTLQKRLSTSTHPQKPLLHQLSPYFFRYLPELLSQKDPIPNIRRIERQLNQTWMLLLPPDLPMATPELAQKSLENHLNFCFSETITESFLPPATAPAPSPSPIPAPSPGAIPRLTPQGPHLRATIPLIKALLQQSESLRRELAPPPLYVEAWMRREEELELVIPFLEQLTAYLLEGAPIQPAIRQFLPSAEEGMLKDGDIALARMRRDLTVGVAIRWIRLAQFLAQAVPVEVQGEEPGQDPSWVEPILPLLQALCYEYVPVALYHPPPEGARLERVKPDWVLMDLPERKISGVVRVEVPILEAGAGALGIASKLWVID